MMKLFRMDNTTGYNQNALDALNAEWETIRPDYDSQDYWQLAASFCDAVAKR